jgi:hypothetical protein
MFFSRHIFSWIRYTYGYLYIYICIFIYIIYVYIYIYTYTYIQTYIPLLAIFYYVFSIDQDSYYGTPDNGDDVYLKWD